MRRALNVWAAQDSAETTARERRTSGDGPRLVGLYANRELVTRHAYGFDSTMYHEFGCV
jgi:hypothetical protein